MSHNKLRDGVSDLALKSVTPTHVHDNSKIYTYRAVSGEKDNLKGYPSKTKKEMERGILIRDLWMQGADRFTTCVS